MTNPKRKGESSPIDRQWFERPRENLTPEEQKKWDDTLRSGIIAQRIVGSGIAVGGTAAALYAKHRLSYDTDHLLMDLRGQFDQVLEKLSESPEWQQARLNRPVLILGSIHQIEVGFRQSRRSKPIDTTSMTTPFGDLVIPTLDEMLGMKAFLTYQRKSIRDFLDFAALSQCTNELDVLSSLMKLDEWYGELQTQSVRLEVARTLADPKPVDLSTTDLSHYKALAPEWQDWSRTRAICKKFGLLLSERIIVG